MITVGGTLDFIIFVGLLAGLFSGALHALVGPVLPRRWRCRASSVRWATS
jgi:hypothetical protein